MSFKRFLNESLINTLRVVQSKAAIIFEEEDGSLTTEYL